MKIAAFVNKESQTNLHDLSANRPFESAIVVAPTYYFPAVSSFRYQSGTDQNSALSKLSI